MNENAKLWVEALRSGKFKQTKQHLADNNGFCCLGVACELYMRKGNKLRVQYDEDVIIYDGERATLPLTVKQWLGLRSVSGCVKDGTNSNVKVELTERNDAGVTFTEIADIIETTPELFTDV